MSHFEVLMILMKFNEKFNKVAYAYEVDRFRITIFSRKAKHFYTFAYQDFTEGIRDEH